MNTKVALSTLAFVIACLLLPSPAVLSAEWSVAPLNPQFRQAQLQRATGYTGPKMTEEGYSLGYLPCPVQLPRVPSRDHAAQEFLPKQFDLRELDVLPPVRNQGACGSCWTFATYGSLESFLLYRRDEPRNFSEQDLNQRHGFDLQECEGGTHFMSMAYLTRWAGPVTERAVPYPYLTAGSSPSAVGPGAVVKHIQQVDLLPPRNGFLDNNLIKRTVMQTGGLFMAFEYRSDSYNKANAAFYTDTNSPNHAVVVVGWDDGYPRNRFRDDKWPPGDGAFIVRNSWGPAWGDHGYFYLSYYDRSASDFVAFHNARQTSNYTQIYQYDPLGWTHSVGIADEPSSVAWFANIFPVAPDAPVIEAVGFYTPVPNSRYVLSIYDGVTTQDPTTGQRVFKQSGSIDMAGYHTVRLRQGVNLKHGGRFSAVVKLGTPGYYFPVPVEARLSNYSSAANAYKGQSFVSADGLTWLDLVSKDDVSPLDPLTLLPYANVALKVFGRAAPAP